MWGILKGECSLVGLVVLYSLMMEQTWGYPIFPSAIFILPQRNYMQQNVPVSMMSPYGMARSPSITFRKFPNIAAAVQVQPSSRVPQQKLNGHQNPQAQNSIQDHNLEQNPQMDNDFDDLKSPNENYPEIIPSQDYQDTISIEPTLTFPDSVQMMNQYPDGRFSIGELIMGVPWLPLEFNVPDGIAWMYNGIASIIGGIGQRFPFLNRPPNEPRPYSVNQMNPYSPIAMPFRIMQIPMPVMNMHPHVMGRWENKIMFDSKGTDQ